MLRRRSSDTDEETLTLTKERWKRQLSKSFTVVIQHLSTRLIKPNFCFKLTTLRFSRVMFNNSTSLGLGSRVRISEGFGLTLVLFVSLVLNLSVCFIIWTTKPLLAKPSNILVGNLCIANLLLTACGIPFSLVTIIKDQHDAYSHSILCQV